MKRNLFSLLGAVSALALAAAAGCTTKDDPDGTGGSTATGTGTGTGTGTATGTNTDTGTGTSTGTPGKCLDKCPASCGVDPKGDDTDCQTCAATECGDELTACFNDAPAGSGGAGPCLTCSEYISSETEVDPEDLCPESLTIASALSDCVCGSSE